MDLINIARQAWHDADSTGEEDYDKLWEAVVTAVTNSLKPPVIEAETPAGTIRLVWATPEVDQHLGYIARVSNPENQSNPDVARLLRYMAEHGHVSPFEMAAACLEINTTRDIGRQILRHRSFSFQEFSQRYASASALGDWCVLRECRLQDRKNRQSSFECADDELADWWSAAQSKLLMDAKYVYEQALARGVAKEQARAVLPEGMTKTRMYMTGSMRSWGHYLTQRLDLSTQKEHRQVAQAVAQVLQQVAPVTMAAVLS